MTALDERLTQCGLGRNTALSLSPSLRGSMAVGEESAKNLEKGQL